MRSLAVMGCAVRILTAVAHAETSPLPADIYFVAGADVPAVPMAAWEENAPQGPQWHAVTGGDAVVKAPARAIRFEEKTVVWPSGTVRVLIFAKAHGGVLYQIAHETELFVLKGAVQATVGGAAVALKTGDVASHPTGWLRNAGSAQDTVLVTWDVASLDGAATPAVVRRSQAQTVPSYQWMKDGKLMRAATDAEAKKAPPDAIRLTVTRYDFPGNSVRVAHIWPASSATAPASAKTDSLIYFTSGHVRFHQAGQVHDVHAGDFIREDASQSHVWEHLTAGSFVTTSALPAGTGSTPPAAAADRPATR